MTAIKSFTEINAWKSARALTKQICSLSTREPISGDWGMRNQLTRAAVSILSYIAEGFGRGSDREFSRFLDIARGSLAEVQSLLFACEDIGYISEQEREVLLKATAETAGLIAGFKRYLKV